MKLDAKERDEGERDSERMREIERGLEGEGESEVDR